MLTCKNGYEHLCQLLRNLLVVLRKSSSQLYPRRIQNYITFGKFNTLVKPGWMTCMFFTPTLSVKQAIWRNFKLIIRTMSLLLWLGKCDLQNVQ